MKVNAPFNPVYFFFKKNINRTKISILGALILLTSAGTALTLAYLRKRNLKVLNPSDNQQKGCVAKVSEKLMLGPSERVSTEREPSAKSGQNSEKTDFCNTVLTDILSLSTEKAQQAQECLKKFGGHLSSDKLLCFSRGKQLYKLKIDTIVNACFKKKQYHENLSGVIENKIIFSSRIQLASFIEFIQIISPNQGEKLKTLYDGLAKLKKYLRDECGIPYQLQDAFGLVSAAIVFPEAFGDENSRWDTANRQLAMSLMTSVFNKLSKKEKKRARFFPAQIPGLREAYEECLGHPPAYVSGGFYSETVTNNLKYRPNYPLPVAISRCMEPTTYGYGGWCINDEQPNYWPTFFPLGLHLVKTDDDDRDEEKWEEQFVLTPMK